MKANEHRVYIDRQTGTWGMAHDLVIAVCNEETINTLEELSDSGIIEVAYMWEEAQR